jgi:hypothetical protein
MFLQGRVCGLEERPQIPQKVHNNGGNPAKEEAANLNG